LDKYLFLSIFILLLNAAGGFSELNKSRAYTLSWRLWSDNSPEIQFGFQRRPQFAKETFD
jgi:hypothetical protein